jgi:RNA polymerase sigma factor (sigma-70 family)
VTKKPFEEIVAQHGPVVLRVCRAMLGPSDAEDAWAETFLAALKAYPGLSEDANLEAWLVTIAHRKAIDSHRARARRPVALAELPERAGTLGRPEDWQGDLWAAVGALPQRQRAAVAYHYLAGLPYQEVASIIGGNTDAVRRAAADGIKKLRETYDGATAGARRENQS